MRDCTICVVTVQLICAFVLAYAKSRFSHEAALLCSTVNHYFCKFFSSFLCYKLKFLMHDALFSNPNMFIFCDKLIVMNLFFANIHNFVASRDGPLLMLSTFCLYICLSKQ